MTPPGYSSRKPPASPYAPRGSNGKIALRCGGPSFAAMSCSAPKPEMPTRSDVADLQAFAASPQDAIRKAWATMATAQQPCAGALDFVFRFGLVEVRPLGRKSRT